ncbi:MAG: hypothetical protein HY777_02690 [Betaproteobacteria bacterium]|nr:hypothetical protein [Betaproteobacteria bacterium]
MCLLHETGRVGVQSSLDLVWLRANKLDSPTVHMKFFLADCPTINLCKMRRFCVEQHAIASSQSLIRLVLELLVEDACALGWRFIALIVTSEVGIRICSYHAHLVKAGFRIRQHRIFSLGKIFAAAIFMPFLWGT